MMSTSLMFTDGQKCVTVDPRVQNRTEMVNVVISLHSLEISVGRACSPVFK